MFGGRYGYDRGCLWWFLPGWYWWPFWGGWGDDTSIGDSWTYGWSGRPTKKPAPKRAPKKVIKADPYFKDDKLEELMAASRFADARDYLRDMLKIAREMGNRQAELNFETYMTKIDAAQLKAKQTKHETSPPQWLKPTAREDTPKHDDGVEMDFL